MTLWNGETKIMKNLYSCPNCGADMREAEP